MPDNGEKRERAVLIGLDTGDGDCEMSIDELKRLADTAGIDTEATVIQKAEKMNVATYIGAGKAEEIREFCKNNEIDLIIADDELKGSQVRELEERTDARVIDRTMLILDIFAMRARSVEGKLQVELAQYKYRLPRLTGYGKALSRLGGGIGTRGPGESKLETDKRHIRRKIESLENELEEVSKRREMTRRNRKKNDVPSVALVGSTNAGKSSLMNSLCGDADVYVQDQLFATLDPTVRKMTSEDGTDVLLIDTVGFIRKLPTELVKAFSSTLEESVAADLLLHVVDCSDPDFLSHISTVNGILSALGATGKPVFTVYNKCDACPPDTVLPSPDKDGTVFTVSAKDGTGLKELSLAIFKQLSTAKKCTLLIPYCDGRIVNQLHENCMILSEEHTDEGTRITALLKPDIRGRFEKYLSE